MEELASLVSKVCSGDLKAFEQIVVRFQDMAYGYSYSILKDFHLAEDAAQEAFIEAYRQLPQLLLLLWDVMGVLKLQKKRKYIYLLFMAQCVIMLFAGTSQVFIILL